MASKKPKKKTGKPSSRQSATGFPLTTEEAEPLQALLDRLGVESWDFLVFGDGSGSNWNRECAWGSVSVERQTMERLVWWGYSNRGTVNVSEGMAAMWPLLWLSSREAERVADGGKRRIIKAHVVTDSQYVQTTGASANRLLAKNGTLWERFDDLARNGILVEWHWIERLTAGLNQYADQLSKMTRLAFKAYNMQERLAAGGVVGGEVLKTVYEVNR